MIELEFQGWNRLRHGGLLLDPPRLSELAAIVPAPLSSYDETELRRRATALTAGDGSPSEFIAFVLGLICGFTEANGAWKRGNSIGSEWSRVTVTGEHIKPRQLWQGTDGGLLPVFMDSETRIGIGRGRKTTSQVLQWLRAGTERLALLTNGQQWRLCFAGLDFDAWCEWDLDLWFEEGELSPQVLALRSLLQPQLWTPASPNRTCPLLQAILDSRKGQAELSQVLGERVREAVEILVQGHGEILKDRCADVDPAEIYRAAVRMVMRLVVVLFAESRDLLPRDNTLYHGAYGLRGLLEELEKTAARGGNRLAQSWNAWPRILALFRLVYHGSHHPKLGIPAYGGELFAAGNAASNDGLIRALAVFETGCFEREMISDRDIHRMLERITRTKVKIRQGRGSTSIPVPVDFSDLSSEYIGILYEGLLDFELRTAPGGDPVIFLAIGNQPALPLSRLESMDDAALSSLLDKMKQTKEEDSEESEETEEVEAAEEASTGDESVEEEPELLEPEDEIPAGDARHTTRTRAETWARRAVAAGGLAPRPRGRMTPERQLHWDAGISKVARQLVSRVVLPGEWYLVRWGGTRKGSGTFYTRPGLAVPTVHRTLRPLAWDPPVDAAGQANHDAPPAQWSAKRPEEILSLKIVDPACGSGTFPVAALRFLTETLYASLHHHRRIHSDGDRAVVSLLQGSKGPDGPVEKLFDELMPCRPDDVSFEPRLKAVLRRHVVERCIYGVDLDPLAVELCRLALWIETMDRTLPFSFLDHKIKCGNSLVGAWFDQFQHYPVMAWKSREGGDKSHSNGVHFKKEARTKAIKAFVEDTLKPDVKRFIEGRTLLETRDHQKEALDVHDETLGLLSRLHNLPVQDAIERARIYRDEVLQAGPFLKLKEAMDRWCTSWFWPPDDLANAPLPTTIANPPTATLSTAKHIAVNKRFFHWELEFPDVYRSSGSGFDAVLGNPPWNTAKPNSLEFFSNIDPLYRSYGKQEAIGFQTQYFADEQIERQWLRYNADFRAQSNFVKFSSTPYGDPEHDEEKFNIVRGRNNQTLHFRWQQARLPSKGYAEPAHPFRHQGSADINLYKLFLEKAYSLLRPGGRLGFIVPSGLYSDFGTKALRELFLQQCQWEWLFNFINWNKIFPSIYYRFKFNAIIVKKGGQTTAIHSAFVRTQLEDWEHAESLSTPYTREQVEQFSPNSKAILEIQSARDLEILETIYSNSVLLGDEGPNGWGIKYTREFDMTNDSELFPPRPKWEAQGYRPDEYSRWLKGEWKPIEQLWAELGIKSLPPGETRCAQPPYDRLPTSRADIPTGVVLSREMDSFIRPEQIKDTALPLYEGRMISHFDFSQKAWVRGKGRGAIWEEIDWSHKFIGPQYLMGSETYIQRMLDQDSNSSMSTAQSAYLKCLRSISLVDVTSSTNARTVATAYCPPFPHGHSAPVLRCTDPLLLTAVSDSLCFDAIMRFKVSGLHVVWSCLEEGALPKLDLNIARIIRRLVCELALSPIYGSPSLILDEHRLDRRPRLLARTVHERMRRRAALDAIMAAVFGVGLNDLMHLLRQVDFPSRMLRDPACHKTLNPTGFWRIDKDKDPEQRHTVLTLVALHDLQGKIRESGSDREKGIEAFCNQNDGEGWMLPETLRLADYGLGHDSLAKEYQPVASRFGPRFYDWQLAQSTEESWREFHLHARNLLGESGYERLMVEVETGQQGGSRANQRRTRNSKTKATERAHALLALRKRDHGEFEIPFQP